MTTQKAIVRIRPKLPRETAANITVLGNEIRVVDDTHYFTTVCPELLTATSAQEDVYRHISPLIQKVTKGYNASVIAYGDTGSGKTFTLYGASKERPGIIDRAIHEVFHSLSSDISRGKHYTVVFSSVFLYNEHVYDLLETAPVPLELVIREATESGVLIENLTECVVNSAESCLELVRRTEEQRKVYEESMPGHMAHVILHCKIESRKVCRHGKLRRMKLTFCDMAGSERDHRYEHSPATLSTRTFTSVVALLAQKGAKYIPYRESKLTLLLQHALHPSSYTCFIHTLSPAASSISSTIDSLKLLAKTANIPLLPEKKVYLANRELTADLRDEVETLREALGKLMPNIPQQSLCPGEREGGSVVEEIEALLRTKHAIVEEIGSARQSPAKQDTQENKFFPGRHIRVGSDVSNPPPPVIPSLQLTPNATLPTLHNASGALSPPGSSSLPPRVQGNETSIQSSDAGGSLVDYSFDRLVVTAVRNRSDERQQRFDSSRNAASSRRNRGRLASQIDDLLSPEELEARRLRVEAEMRRLEEEKAAFSRRLENTLQKDRNERLALISKLNRRPAIEPRPQRPLRALKDRLFD